MRLIFPKLEYFDAFYKCITVQLDMLDIRWIRAKQSHFLLKTTYPAQLHTELIIPKLKKSLPQLPSNWQIVRAKIL